MTALRIFVVEDHPDTLEYLILYLESLGHTVCHASTVEGALEAIPHAACDLLLSDVGLNDGTGWDLLTRLKEGHLRHPGIAIAMSGYGRLADRERSAAAGFRHHLVKPFDADRLDTLLEEAAAGCRH
jgi:CheY-like chemotaxis protein